MNKFYIIASLVAIVGICYMVHIDCESQAKNQKYVYELLEKNSLTADEAEKVKDMTDPDVMKEGYVILDDSHREMFKKHFGIDR